MEKQKAQDDLEFIRKVMEDSRRTVADNGLHYINWSVMPAIGVLLTYSIALMELPGSYILWAWAGVIGVAWLITFRLGDKEQTAGKGGFAEKILSSVWVASGITMTISAFAGVVSGAISPEIIPAVIATIVAVPYIIAGIVYNLNWFKWIAVAWWISGGIFFFWQSFHSLMVFGVLILILQAGPGIYLYKRFKREHKPAV